MIYLHRSHRIEITDDTLMGDRCWHYSIYQGSARRAYGFSFERREIVVASCRQHIDAMIDGDRAQQGAN